MSGGRNNQIRMCSPEELCQPELIGWKPTMMVIDEAHQLARQAWVNDEDEQAQYAAMTALCHQARIVLLLSGTPMHGNERHFLAMLHCINPQAWQLNAVGIEKFMRRVAERERLGGIYSSLTPETPNGVLEEVIEELRQLFADDEQL
ncbi:SNF2-related protein, partial [Salmonella enterica subsp. enterica serovar Lubbock]|nr:SNF2-related protein [Salmonella enterica subsp. enterica serovar Lubbock]